MTSPARKRVVRGVTIVLALAVIGYAVSDHPFYGGEPGFGMTQLVIAAVGVVLASAAWWPLSWNKRALLACFSALLMLVVLEVAMELMFAPRYRPTYQFHERYLFALKPDTYGEYIHPEINGGDRILTRINERGFVGEDLQPREGQRRVVVYGDSFIHAFYTENSRSFTQALERQLAERLDEPVEVINAGVASYGPDQISLKMSDELPWLEPDLVVVAVFAGNDYGDLLRNKIFRLGDNGDAVRNDYRVADEVRMKFELSQRESILKRALRQTVRGLGEASPYAQVDPGAEDPDVALVEGSLQWSFDEYRDYVIEGNDVVTNTHADHYDADISLAPNSDSARYKIRLMEGVLRKIKRVADARSVPLCLLFIPHPMDVADEYDVGRVDRTRHPDYERSNLTDPLQLIAERHDIPYVNLFDTYRQRDANQLYLHGGDDHWNAAGQKLGAERLASFVLSRDLLAGGRDP